MGRRNEHEKILDAAQARIRRRAKRLSKVPLPERSDCHNLDYRHSYGTLPKRRELEVMAEICLHGDLKQVAACLGISYQTVKNHSSAIHCRLGTTSIVQTLFYLGWVKIPGQILTRLHE